MKKGTQRPACLNSEVTRSDCYPPGSVLSCSTCLQGQRAHFWGVTPQGETRSRPEGLPGPGGDGTATSPARPPRGQARPGQLCARAQVRTAGALGAQTAASRPAGGITSDTALWGDGAHKCGDVRAPAAHQRVKGTEDRQLQRSGQGTPRPTSDQGGRHPEEVAAPPGAGPFSKALCPCSGPQF